MQHKAVYLLFWEFTLHVSGVNHNNHQEYTRLLLQPPVLVMLCYAATSLQRDQVGLAMLERGSYTKNMNK